MHFPKIIFVDDDPDDRDLILECLKRNDIEAYEIFESGHMLIRFLHMVKDHEMPEVIVLDLNMPVMNGYQVLKELKSTERFQKIPVFLLTTSQRLLLVEHCIREGAAGYYQKPRSIEQYNSTIRELYQYAIE